MIAAKHVENSSHLAFLVAKHGVDFRIISGDDTCKKASTILSTLPYFLKDEVTSLPFLSREALQYLLAMPWVVDQLHLKTHVTNCTGESN